MLQCVLPLTVNSIFEHIVFWKVSVDESIYVTDEDIETHIWLEINTHCDFFLDKQSFIADLSQI
jgi:hypothetical protein